MFGLDLIEQATSLLEGKARRTPLLESALLNDELGMQVLFKPECLQITGSFKFRGAYTKLARLTPQERERGVVAFSSGNHAQGVAYAAQMFGCKATIVMPSDAPRLKIDNTKAYQADVILYDRFNEDREAIGKKLSDETGAVLVKPYDDHDIMSGQGTVGLEIADQLAEIGCVADAVFCPAGGGGLIAGLSCALSHKSPETRVYSAEPIGFEDTKRSLEAGRRVANEPGAQSICDAIVTPMPGELTFAVNEKTLAGGFAVSDQSVIQAMGVVFERLKVVSEPGATVGFAALRENAGQFKGQTVVVVLSGGNVDLGSFADYSKSM